MADKDDVESGPEKDNADAPMTLDQAIATSWGNPDADEAPETDEPEAEAGETADVEATGDDDTPDDREAGEDAGESDADDEEAAGGDLSAPEHWPAERREAFAKLPKEARELLLSQSRDLEKGFTRKSQELSEEARFAESVRKEFEPLRDQLKMAGMDEVAGIRQLVAAHQLLERDPQRGIEYLAQQYGVAAPSQAQGQQPQQQPGQQNGQKPKYVDPDIAALQSEIGQIRDQFGQMTNAQQQARMQEVQKQITEFQSAKDEAGNPAHPHFETVQNEMARLIQAGVASDLRDAYDKAVWANPDLRAQQIEAERKAVAEAEAKRRQEAVAKAKKAGRRVKGDNRPGTEPTKPNDLSSIINDAISAHAG